MKLGIRNRLVVNLHGIGEPPDNLSSYECRYWCSRAVWPRLADALSMIVDEGEVSLEITFDDGYLSDFEDALPELRERSLTATFFVSAGMVGKPGFMSVEHLRALRDADMRIGSHGWSHIDLRGLSREDLLRETVDSRARIAELIDARVTAFAIPFGNYDRTVLRALRGYDVVYTSDWIRAHATDWLTPRVSYANDVWTPDDLPKYAYGKYSPISMLRRELITLYKRLR